MKALWKPIFAISVALAMTACAPEEKSPSSAPQTQENKEPEKQIPKINGMDVDKFYAQFYIKVSGTCTPNTVKYEYPKSGIVQIGFDLKNVPVLANISLVMTSDNNYRAIYREYGRAGFGGSILIVLKEKIIPGTWKIEETSLILEGLGVATGLLSNSHSALRLRFEEDIIQPGIKNRTMLLEKSSNPWAPFPEFIPCDL